MQHFLLPKKMRAGMWIAVGQFSIIASETIPRNYFNEATFPGLGSFISFNSSVNNLYSLVEGGPFVRSVELNVHVDIHYTSTNILRDSIIWSLQANGISLCCDGGAGVLCEQYDFNGAHPVPIIHLSETDRSRGLGRVSCWMQTIHHGVPSIIGNHTVLLWSDEVTALEEMRRLRVQCNLLLEPSCALVLDHHQRIAEARLPSRLQALGEFRTPRIRRNIEVVTNIFNGLRWNNRSRVQPEMEGSFVATLSMRTLSSIHFTVFSATLVNGGSFESSLPPGIQERSNMDVLPFANPGRAQECPAVLTFIVENYDKLPDLMIFLHGDPEDHNAAIFHELEELFAHNEAEGGGLPDVSFVHANAETFGGCYFMDNLVGSISSSLGLDTEFLGSFKTGVNAIVGQHDDYSTVFGEHQPCFLAKYCCAQFIVSRAAVMSRPKKFYRLALKLSLDLRDCFQLEWLWHAIFRHEAFFSGFTIRELLSQLRK